MYHFDLSGRVRQAAQQAEQRAWTSAELVPAGTAAQPIGLPVFFGSAINLIGFKIITQAQSSDMTLITYWQVNDPPAAAQRLFVHALDAHGQIAAQDDRQDTNARDWRSGDLIAEVSHLSVPADAGPVWIEAGWYDPASNERLPLLLNGQAIDQRILLNRIETQP